MVSGSTTLLTVRCVLRVPRGRSGNLVDIRLLVKGVYLVQVFDTANGAGRFTCIPAYFDQDTLYTYMKWHPGTRVSK